MNSGTSPSVVDAAKTLSQCKRPPAHPHTHDDHGADIDPNNGAISQGNKRIRKSIADDDARSAVENCASFQARVDNIVNECHATIPADIPHGVSQAIGFVSLPSQRSQNAISATSMVVRLHITKVEPSYTEPWRKMSPVSIEGLGVVLSQAVSHDLDCDSTVHTGPTGADKADTTINLGNHTTTEQPRNNKKASGLRIVTAASNVNHHTHIRVLIPSSSYAPVSVACFVEWISLSMDLAILTLQHAVTTNCLDEVSTRSSTKISDRLPMLGEQVTFIGLTQGSTKSLSSGCYGHGWDNLHSYNCNSLTKMRGTVSNFYADEDHHFVLRMNVDIPTMNYAGGIIIDDYGSIVGILGSTLDSRGSSSFIPGVVVNQFIKQCELSSCHFASSSRAENHGNHASETGSTWTTAGDTDSECRKTIASPTKQADSILKQRCERRNEGQPTEPDIQNLKSRKTLYSTIASLGITGYQTLQNKALRQACGVSIDDIEGVRITGVHHIAHAMSNANYDYDPSHCNQEDSHCHSSSLKADDVLLAVAGEPVMMDGTVRLAPGREKERVDFRWLVSKCKPGTQVQLDLIRQQKRIQIYATLSSHRYLVPRIDEESDDELPSYVIAGGCVFVPLSRAWMAEALQRNSHLEFEGFHRYLQEQRKGKQQLIILSHVLADEVNLGYHGMGNLLLTSVNGQRLANMQHLVDILVKSDIESTLELRCTSLHSTRAKIVICMDSKQVMNSESSILGRYMIDAWCSENALSPTLKRESEMKTHRHGITCGLKTMRAIRNAISETTIVVQTTKSDAERVVSTTKRILNLSEAHKMQSAPNFSGKYVEDVGWTQVKTKHLSQLCQCGKSTRFYCICSVGVMRCKDCFLKHCRDHILNGPEEGCGVCGEKSELLAEGIDLVTTRKRKPNNPNQAAQSRCAVCRAKTCFCCSACGFEPEIPLCDVTTGRNCLAIHTSEQHSCKHDHHA